jgi:hypothetical protein
MADREERGACGAGGLRTRRVCPASYHSPMYAGALERQMQLERKALEESRKATAVVAPLPVSVPAPLPVSAQLPAPVPVSAPISVSAASAPLSAPATAPVPVPVPASVPLPVRPALVPVPSVSPPPPAPTASSDAPPAAAVPRTVRPPHRPAIRGLQGYRAFTKEGRPGTHTVPFKLSVEMDSRVLYVYLCVCVCLGGHSQICKQWPRRMLPSRLSSLSWRLPRPPPLAPPRPWGTWITVRRGAALHRLTWPWCRPQASLGRRHQAAKGGGAAATAARKR